jgi:hypothetical protein
MVAFSVPTVLVSPLFRAQDTHHLSLTSRGSSENGSRPLPTRRPTKTRMFPGQGSGQGSGFRFLAAGPLASLAPGPLGSLAPAPLGSIAPAPLGFLAPGPYAPPHHSAVSTPYAHTCDHTPRQIRTRRAPGEQDTCARCAW